MYSPKKKKKGIRENINTRGEGEAFEEGKEKRQTRSRTVARVAAKAVAALAFVRSPVRSSRSTSASTPDRMSISTSPDTSPGASVATSAESSPGMSVVECSSTSADTSADAPTGTSVSTSAGTFSDVFASTSAGTSTGTPASIATSASTSATTILAIEEMNEIGEEDLWMLAVKYKQPCVIPYGRSMVTNGARLLPSAELMQEWTIEFSSPGDAWQRDGTFFVCIEYGGRFDVAIFTLEEKGLTSIYCGLMMSSRIHYKRPVVFKNIHECICPTVTRVIREKNLKILSQKQYCIYKLKKSEALRTNIKIPENVEVKEIQTVQADMVYATWTEYYPDSVEYVRTLVRMNGGYVAISKPEGKQLSWVLKSVMGQIAFVESKREFLRQGNASLLLKILAKDIAIEGNDPIAFVPSLDKPAQKLFEKLGYENVGICHDIEVIDESGEKVSPLSPTTSLQEPSSSSVRFSTLKSSLSDST